MKIIRLSSLSESLRNEIRPFMNEGKVHMSKMPKELRNKVISESSEASKTHSIIALLNKNGIIKMSEIESQLQENNCTIKSKWDWGGIAIDSPLTIQELKDLNIPGIESYEKEMTATIQTNL